MVEREEMDWDLYGKAVRELAQTIADDDSVSYTHLTLPTTPYV